jgi:hypothetical protein
MHDIYYRVYNTVDTADAIITKLRGGSQECFRRILEDAKAHHETLTISTQDANRTYVCGRLERLCAL